MIPFLLGTAYLLYHYDRFILTNFLIMLVSLLAFDMATTTLNNYSDYKNAVKTDGYGYEQHNAIVKYRLKPKTVQTTYFTLLFIAVASGIALVYQTDWVVLFTGMFAFFIGVIYSYGPVPVSRTPLGEILSGFTMGFFIPFLAVYIHIFESGPLMYGYADSIFTLRLDLDFFIRIFLFSWAPIATIANIMLANNLCDIDEDIENNRYTLPIYIGPKKALFLFESIYDSIYVVLMLLIFSQTIPLTGVISFITFVPVKRNVQKFKENQEKKSTFSVAIANFLLINGSLLLAFVLALAF